jgi:AcrR family transcriptional regulator/DNA-binding MarR family transcriptional regulator
MASRADKTPPTVSLRSVPNALPHRQAVDIQRARILMAAAEAVRELGYGRATVGEVISRARISRKTFYDVYRNREDCVLALFEQTLAEAGRLARSAYAQATSWRAGVRLALATLLRTMDERPALARLCLIEACGAGERIQARRAEVLTELARVIDLGRVPGGRSDELPQTTAEGVVGAVVNVLQNRLMRGDEQPLIDLLGPLMSIVVLPYHGPRAARRELQQPHPAAPRKAAAQAPPRDPLQGLSIRLTHRTVRVLMAIADHPGASNREVAEVSGIIDQGQISKLMDRLERFELVENRGHGWEMGTKNAWQLTPKGAHLERATRPR